MSSQSACYAKIPNTNDACMFLADGSFFCGSHPVSSYVDGAYHIVNSTQSKCNNHIEHFKPSDDDFKSPFSFMKDIHLKLQALQ